MPDESGNYNPMNLAITVPDKSGNYKFAVEIYLIS